MNCVNKKSKEFKKLVADYNVSENTMELLIHKYWREKRSEEDFPTRAYLNAHLGLAPYEESIDSVIKVWNKMYSHPITYDKKINAYKAKNNALKIFPSKAVNLYLNAEGKYVLSVRKPVKNLKAELDRIADNGSFSEKSLNLDIEKNKKYQVNKLESLFNQFNTDRTSKALAYKAFNLANSLKISVYFTDMNDENLGKYIPGKGIYFNKDFFSRLDNNEKKASIILHETLHAVCNYALSSVIRDEDKPQAALDFKNEITKIYNRAKYFEALKGEVGITSVREFVAELSNPLFREKLQSIKNINNMSLWQKIVEAIKKFLNIHSSSDYYTRAMNTLNNALDAFDKNTYMEYNGILDELRKSQDGKHILSTKAKAFLNTLSDEEVNNFTRVINREISDYKLATEEQSSKRSKQYFTFDDGTQVEAPFTLNEQQAKALNEMNRFIHSDETAMTLSGYAGTGKTSLMEMLRNRAWKEGKDVIFTATTNKAAAVLKSKVGDGAMTLNKAFGISVEVNTSKAYDAKNLVNKIKESNHIHYGSIVVIDEASMINETNYAVLNDIARGLGAKIIYVGDSAQLAPVKETKVSKVFRDENGKTIELTQVERTGDNAILREATDVRNGKGLSGISSFNKEGKGVAYLRPQQKKEIGDIVRHFLPQIKENPDNFKIIAFTNNKVASYNEAVRKTLGYNDSTPRVGESIMGYLNYGYRKGGSYDFINSENYKVIHVSPAHTNTIVVNGTVYETTVNNVTLEGPDGETHTFAFTDVKHNQHNRQVAYTLGNIVAKLWETYRWSHDRDIPGRINAINTALFINDDIKEGDRTIVPKVYDFGYAITAHKSQGSTFKNVLIDDVDIQTARGNDVDLSTPADNYDVADPSSMMPAGKVAMNDVHDMNGATELSSASFSLGEETSSETKPVTKPHSDTVSLVQQLEYVAISRATDTATIISDNVKKEGSPLHPEKSLMEESSESTMSKQPIMLTEPNKPIPSVTQQLVKHLKSQGINVLGREAMAEFLKTHKLEYLQQAIKEQKEIDTIKQKAIADGTFMKAPNGKPTNLNEKQWLQVRTRAFKEWFGDWERAANASRVSLGKEIPNIDEYSKYGQKGETDIEIREVLDENGNVIGTVRMEFSGKGRKGVVTLHPKLTITGKGYGTALYQHIADKYNINVEESFGEIGKSDAAKRMWNKMYNAVSKDPETPLRQLTPSNSSKVVDENEEPLVVYHGTDATFNIFSKEKRGEKTEALSATKAFFAASNLDNSFQYVTQEVYDGAVSKIDDIYDVKQNAIDKKYSSLYQEYVNYLTKREGKKPSLISFREDNEFTRKHQKEIQEYTKELDAVNDARFKEQQNITNNFVKPLFLNIRNPKIDSD